MKIWSPILGTVCFPKTVEHNSTLIICILMWKKDIISAKKRVLTSNGVKMMCLKTLTKMYNFFSHKCIFFQKISRLKAFCAKNISQWTEQSLSGFWWKDF